MICKRIIKYIIWLIGLAVICTFVFSVLRPKYYFFNQEFMSPETEIWDDFYHLPENTIDIAFVGSSHVYDGINTMKIYEDTGWKAFNMSSSSQDMMVSYYYIKEMFNRQSPEYVVVDTYGMLYEAECDYSKTVRAFQDMKCFSSVRIEAINDYVDTHMEGGIKYKVNMMFPFINAHSRWENLTNYDFNPKMYDSTEMGYVMLTEHLTRGGEIKYYTDEEFRDVADYAKEYFAKIVELCAENDAKLLVMTIPYMDFNEGMAASVKRYIDEYGVEYCNYGDYAVCEEMGLSNCTDWKNDNHLNWNGANKLTQHIIDEYIEKGYIQPKEKNSAMAAISDRYVKKAIINDFRATYTVSDYLNLVKRYGDRVSLDVVIARGNENSDSLTREIESAGYSIRYLENNKIIIGNVDYYIDQIGIEFIVTDAGSGEVIDAVVWGAEDNFFREKSNRKLY